MNRENATPVDIMLLLEGTYPYVRGGVSSWVHEIVQGLPEVSFSLAYLGAKRDPDAKPRFELPPNVRAVHHHYLFDTDTAARPRTRPGRPEPFADAERLHDHLRAREALPPELMQRIALSLGAPEGLTREEFLHSELAWDRVTRSFEERCTDPSFLDYFWSVRTIHAPLFSLARFAAELPPARVYHTVSTGYAGLLGALASQRNGRPLITTEHGIYTKERAIDLASAEWIRDPPGGSPDGVGYLRRLWIRFFEGLGRIAYSASQVIVSLYEGNRQRQIADGAPVERTRIVPNGIDVDRFRPVLRQRAPEPPLVVGLFGRVVPIKDVKTFVRAMRIVCDRLPQAEGWIVGPTEEDENYARECRELVQMLGLNERVKFLGFKKPEEILPKLGALAVTSISEALPLGVLEAFASGVPVVASDVGACRELIEGRTAPDRALGSAGAVFSISDPAATANALVTLLGDRRRWDAAQRAGLARVARYYSRPSMLAAYRKLYEDGLYGEGR